MLAEISPAASRPSTGTMLSGRMEPKTIAARLPVEIRVVRGTTLLPVMPTDENSMLSPASPVNCAVALKPKLKLTEE